MSTLLISGLAVFAARILQDLVFNFKIEMFNRGNKPGVCVVNFFESIIAMTIIAMVIRFINEAPILLVSLGMGSSLGGLAVIAIRDRMNRKLVGQRQYFARVSFTGNEDLIGRLTEEGFIFSVDRKEFTDGVCRTVIEGSMKNRARKEHFKQLLKGRQDKFVTIIPAREVYWV